MVLPRREFPTGTEQLRQWQTIDLLLSSVEMSIHWATVLVVGSFATGQADAMSDVDAFILVDTGTFPMAWNHRHELHGQSVIACWDTGLGEPGFGGHKWLTTDLVYFDCAIAEPQTVKLAGPSLVAAGREDLFAGIASEPVPSKPDPVWSIEPKPIPVAYAELKLAVRALTRPA